jgi:4-alpha-glucanotransferase
MNSVAGVPPDYFSATGQLWNMPIYDWQRMKDDRYDWWKRRICKNLEYCDMLRFDHFRGFSSFWKVPAGEETAIKGEWTRGPADAFFTILKEEFPEMPFIAEDLGDIDAEVYKLRDDFNLPGMKVLQFAFGDNMPHSVHIPHLHTRNSIVYTGTHDNNTIRGWYRKEVTRKNRDKIRHYLNRKIKLSGVTEEFIRMAMGSVARIAIIPLQDLKNLDETARFNDPSLPEGNWTWKLKGNDVSGSDAQRLKELTELYGREP